MRILIDCDVLLDVVLERQPYVASSGALLDWAEQHPGSSAVAWHTLSNLEYLIRGGARAFIADLIRFVEVPETGNESMRFALETAIERKGSVIYYCIQKNRRVFRRNAKAGED